MGGNSVGALTHPVPWVFELAAELEGERVDRLYSDPAVISRSLNGAVDLFDLPAVCVSFDTTLVANAVGCEVDHDSPDTGGVIASVDDAFEVDIDALTESGQVPVVLEATERLAATCDALVLGPVTGPALLTEQVLSDPEGATSAVREEATFTAGDLDSELAAAYLDAGADGIALLEPEGAGDSLYEEAARPIANVVDHYEASGVVITSAVDERTIRLAGRLGFDLVTGVAEDPASALTVAADAGVDLGIGVPRDAFLSGPEAVTSFSAKLPDDALLSSEWTLPVGTTPEAVFALVDR